MNVYIGTGSLRTPSFDRKKVGTIGTVSRVNPKAEKGFVNSVTQNEFYARWDIHAFVRPLNRLDRTPRQRERTAEYCIYIGLTFLKQGLCSLIR